MVCWLYFQNNVNSFLKFIFFIQLLYPFEFSKAFHHCHHRPPRPEEVQHVYLEPAHLIKKRSNDEPQPLRIHVVYHESVYALPQEKYNVINETVLPQALDYWKNALRVKPLQTAIRLTRRCTSKFLKRGISSTEGCRNNCENVTFCVNNCENVTMCGEVEIPNKHLEQCHYCDSTGKNCGIDPPTPPPGIENADFVFYVSAIQTERCYKGLTVAYAAHCQQEATLDRPIAGHANLCPDSISTKPQDLDTLLSTVKHEILHALGFSVSLYAYFRSKDGTPLTERDAKGKPQINKKMHTHQWSNRVIRVIERSSWKVHGGTVARKVNMLVTPKVVEEVRKHFNCPILEGAELEDQGEDGTFLTHWEKRVFENEAMTGTHTQNPVYSRITLALMEDTGWYFPNYDMAQPLKWGKNLGCDFAMKSCKDWIDSHREKKKSIYPFCDKVKRDPLETECTDNRDSVALCNLMEYEGNLHNAYQNFDHIPGIPGANVGRFGGSVILADYCPYIQEFTWKSNGVVIRGSQCQFSENNPLPEKNFALEYYGPESKCFNHNKEMWEEQTCYQVRMWQHWGSGCYKYKCAGNRLHIIVLDYTYTCYYAGQELKIQLLYSGWLHVGTIVCPPCKEICAETNMRCDQDIIKAYPKALQNSASYRKDFLTCSSRRNNPTKYVSFILQISLSFLLFSR